MGFQTGWHSFSKDGEERYEGFHEEPENAELDEAIRLDRGSRPVAQGEEGNLLFIEQIDYGHRVGIDLRYGVILIDYEKPATMQNGTLEINNPRTILFMADETNIVGEMAHLEQKFTLKLDEKGRKIHDANGKLVEERTDILIPLTFRPIWFTRFINDMKIKVIGAQVTLPELQGGGNNKKLISLYPDGRIGIS